MNIKYRPGNQMTPKDALSRLDDTSVNLLADEEVLSNWPLVMILMILEELVRYMQQANLDTCRLLNILGKGKDDRTPYERNAVNKFKLLDGLLY